MPNFWKNNTSFQPTDFEHKVVSSSDPFSTVYTDNMFASFGKPEEKKKIDCP